MTGVFSKLRSAATKRRVHSLIDAGCSCFVQNGCRARKSPNAWAFTSTRLANVAAGSCRLALKDLLTHIVMVCHEQYLTRKPLRSYSVRYTRPPRTPRNRAHQIHE